MTGKEKNCNTQKRQMFRALKRLRPGVLSCESNMIGFRAKASPTRSLVCQTSGSRPCHRVTIR